VSVLYALRAARADAAAAADLDPAADATAARLRISRFDTTLAFALPLAAFGIQSRFTSGAALALAAAVAGAVYLLVASLLLRRGGAAQRLFAEANFALGVGFLTLAVPLAASAQWTSAAWAVEGVALLWVGLRQRRALPVVAGIALHALGALMLLDGLQRGTPAYVAGFNGLTMNLAVFAAAAFASAALLRRVATLTPGAPFGMPAARLVGWAWVALALGQALPFPGHLVAWCALALVLGVVGVRPPRGAPLGASLSGEWLAAVLLIVAAAAKALAGDNGPWPAAAAGSAGAPVAWTLLGAGIAAWTTAMRLLVAVTAALCALLSLRGQRPVDASAAAGQRTTDPQRRAAQRVLQVRRRVAAALLTLGVGCWAAALMVEVVRRSDRAETVVLAGLALVLLTAWGLTALGARLRWSWPVRLSWSLYAAQGVVAAWFVAFAVVGGQPPGAHWGALVWPLAWLAYAGRVWLDDRATLPVRFPFPVPLHAGGALLLTLMVAAESALRLDALAPGGAWFHAAWGAVPAVALWLALRPTARWPIGAAPQAYRQVAAPALAAVLGGWLFWAGVTSDGHSAPLTWLPLLNPLDVAMLLAVGALAAWSHSTTGAAGRDLRGAIGPVVGAAAFWALNTAALRAVHQLAGVPWQAGALFDSLVVQAVLSLLWTLTAMGLMVAGHRIVRRPPWLAGAGLLALVVVKLFFVDLAGQGTIERIVSFVGVGGLLLVIGYVAPVPPAAGARRGRGDEAFVT
jgi:uncharacterized membrane protein